MSLGSDLAALNAGMAEKMPAEIQKKISSTNTTFQASFDPKATIQVGAHSPPFDFGMVLGKKSLEMSYLSKVPSWSPFIAADGAHTVE